MSVRKITFAISLIALAIGATGSASARGVTSYGIGIEGFQDKYKEPELDLVDKTNYGSVTAHVSKDWNRFFAALDGRASYGEDDYESPSGTLSGVPQYEYELRARFGKTYSALGGSFSPYIGLGARYFVDQGKGYVTNTGAQAYDRRILQAYVPVGASLAYVSDGGWSITPQAEADFIFFGNVDSRLTNITAPGLPYVFSDPANNRQNWGLGVRSELMFGKTIGTTAVQIGPFVRYWWVPESDDVTYDSATPGGPSISFVEPKNNRLQVGGALRILW